MTKQTPRQRKALRSAAAKKGSLRRKTPAHPSPAASTESLFRFDFRDMKDPSICRATVFATATELTRLGNLDIFVRPRELAKIPPEMGAEARSAEPVQSDPNPWPRFRTWIRKLVGR